MRDNPIDVHSIYYVLGQQPYGFTPEQVGAMPLAAIYQLLAKPKANVATDVEVSFNTHAEVEAYAIKRRAMRQQGATNG